MKAIKIATLALVAATGAAFVAPSADAAHRGKAHASCPALNVIDPDADGAMTLLEAYRAGVKTFRKINPDGDFTLEADELAGRMSKAAIASADRNKDGRLSLGEYLREIRNRFNYANPDKDRTIECDELHSKYGRLLARLLN